MNFLDERLPSRLWDKLMPEPNSGCWLWIGARSALGYGHLMVRQGDGRRIYQNAHRVVYEIVVGSAANRDVDHLCRTPACCNPAHLEAVTHAENMRRGDVVAKMNVARIAKYAAGDCHRHCGKCGAEGHYRTTCGSQVAA